MQHGKTKMALATAVALLTALTMMLSSCANTPDNTDAPTTVGQQTTGPNSGNNNGENNNKKDDEITLTFGESFTESAEIEGTKTVSVAGRSNDLKIVGSSAFTVKVGDKTLTSDGENTVTLENTASVNGTMKLEIASEQKQTLTFTLLYDEGTEQNPYTVAAEKVELTYTEEVYFNITVAGWYKLSGGDFELANYTLDADGKVYLAAGTYSGGTFTAGEQTLTVEPTSAPAGYEEENYVEIENNTGKLLMMNGTTLYFHFTAPSDGLYIFSMGTTGISHNCRFTVSYDDHAKYYGMDLEDGQWVACKDGRVYANNMAADTGITIAVTYADGASLKGSEDVTINVTTPKTVAKLDEVTESKLISRGTVFFAYTAANKGYYKASFDLSDVNDKCRMSIWTLVEEEQDDSMVSAVGYKWNKTPVGTDGQVQKLEAGETMYIVVDSAEEISGNVSIFVSESETDDDLPAEGWASGTYECGRDEIVIDRERKTISYQGEAAVPFYYSADELLARFKVAGYNLKIKLAENGKDLIVWKYEKTEAGESDRYGTHDTYAATPVFDAVTVDKLSGSYSCTDENGNTYTITIYPDGSGRLGIDEVNNITDQGNGFDAEKNVLYWGRRYNIRIDELNADGTVKSIRLTTDNKSRAVYTRTGDAAAKPAETLPMGESEFVGTDGYTMSIASGRWTINGAGATILDGLSTDKVFRISAYTTGKNGLGDKIEMILKIVDEETVQLYYADGTTLLTTLTRRHFTIGELSGAGETATETEATDDGNGNRFLTVKTSGWYRVSPANGAAMGTIWTGCTVPAGAEKPNLSNNNKNISEATWVELTENDIIGLYYLEITAYSAEKPAAEGNTSYNWDGTSKNLGGILTGDTECSFIFTAPKAGNYTILIKDGNDDDQRLWVTYNGQNYGRYFDANAGSFGAWVDADRQCEGNEIRLELGTLAEGQSVTFTIRDSRGKHASSWTLCLEGAEDNGGEDDTQYATFTPEQQGTYILTTTEFGREVTYKLVITETGANLHIIGENEVEYGEQKLVWSEEDGCYYWADPEFECVMMSVAFADGKILWGMDWDTGEILYMEKEKVTIIGTWKGTDVNGTAYRVIIREDGLDYAMGYEGEMETMARNVKYTVNGNVITATWHDSWFGEDVTLTLKIVGNQMNLACVYDECSGMTKI